MFNCKKKIKNKRNLNLICNEIKKKNKENIEMCLCV